MRDLTRREIVSLVCDMVEKAKVPTPQYQAGHGSSWFRFNWESTEVSVYLDEFPSRIMQSICGNYLPSEIRDKWLVELSAVISLACQIEAALKDVRVVEEKP